MIPLIDVSYCRLTTRDLAGAERFCLEVLGLEVSERRRGAVHFKSDNRDHTLVYSEGDPNNSDEQVLGIEITDAAALDAAAATLEGMGIAIHRGTAAEAEERHVKDFIAFQDLTGNALELVLRPATTGRRYHGSRDAGITGFSHVGLYTKNPERDEAFWTEVLGARVSDRIGDAPLMRLGPIHHSIALFPAQRSGIQHINHQVAGTDDIQRAASMLWARGVDITFGPGRHPTSSAQFLYFSGPDGLTYEYSTGVREIHDEPAWHNRQFPFAPLGFCQWGSRPNIPAFKD